MKNYKLFVMWRCIAALLIFCSCSKSGADASHNYPREANIEYRITLISGGGTMLLSATYTDVAGDVRLNDQTLPFVKKVKKTVNRGDDIGASFLFNAPPNPNTTISIRIDILIDGTLVKTETFTAVDNVIGSLVYIFI
jgi:hypothetical protein